MFDKEVARFVKQNPELEITSSLATGINAAGDLFLAKLDRRSKRMLKEHRRDWRGFQRRLEDDWGTAFDQLYTLLVIAREAGEEINSDIRPQAIEANDYLFDALVRLHARACQVGLEVHHLITGGFAAGALARWRTLHELAVVAAFLVKHGKNTAERYLLHHVMASRKGVRQYERYYSRLGYAPPDAVDIARVQNASAALIARFGEEYKEDYGWASAALGIRKPSFAQLEEAVGLDHYRPHYGMSSHGVHAGSKGAYFNIGGPADVNILPAGASNSGFVEPGHCCALSMLQITAAVLTVSSTVKRLIVVRAMQASVDRIAISFVEAQHAIDRRSERNPNDHS